LISVGGPIAFMRLQMKFEKGTIRLLTWGGLRGGLSIAMALALPPTADKPMILALTYAVVLFSVLVQGLSFKRVIKAILGRPATR
jgi:CPA1 family monovalent cation:H+ antiporter